MMFSNARQTNSIAPERLIDRVELICRTIEKIMNHELGVGGGEVDHFQFSGFVFSRSLKNMVCHWHFLTV
jgi:hypothetical protein